MRPRPAFVLTTCALGACSSEPQRPPEVRPTASASAAPSASAPPKPVEAKRKRQPKGPAPQVGWIPISPKPGEAMKAVNPTDAAGRVVFVSADDRCYVEEPRAGSPPPDGPERFAPWVTQTPVDCPPQMDDPAFATCTGRLMQHLATQDVCACLPNGGNPPPPPLLVPCPEKLP